MNMQLSPNNNGNYSNRSIASNINSSVPRSGISGGDLVADFKSPYADQVQNFPTNRFNGDGTQMAPEDKVEISPQAHEENRNSDLGAGWVESTAHDIQSEIDRQMKEAKQAMERQRVEAWVAKERAGRR